MNIRVTDDRVTTRLSATDDGVLLHLNIKTHGVKLLLCLDTLGEDGKRFADAYRDLIDPKETESIRDGGDYG